MLAWFRSTDGTYRAHNNHDIPLDSDDLELVIYSGSNEPPQGRSRVIPEGDQFYRHTFHFASVYAFQFLQSLFEPIKKGNLHPGPYGRPRACYKGPTITRVYCIAYDDDGNQKDIWSFRFTAARQWRIAFSQMRYELDTFLQKIQVKPAYDFEACVGVEVESRYVASGWSVF